MALTRVTSKLVTFLSSIAGAVLRTVFSKLSDTVHVNDFGGDLKVALQNVPPYTTIVLGLATYDITGLYKTTSGGETWVGNTKAGIRLVGAGMPRLSSNGRYLTGGTVIQGTLFNLANDFEVSDLGVDVGEDVRTNLYAGVYKEVFLPGVNITYPTPAPTIKNVKVDNVIALGCKPGGSAHTMLFENLEDCVIGHVEAIGSFHCFVSKVVGLKAGSITARGGPNNAVIFKSDPANRCEDNQVGLLTIDSWTCDGVSYPPGPLRFDAIQAGGHTTSKVKIGTAIIKNVAGDSIINSGVGISQGCAIGHLEIDTAANACAVRLGLGSSIQRFSIGSFNIITGGRVFDLGSDCYVAHIGNGTTTVIGDSSAPLLVFNDPSQRHGIMTIAVEVAQTYGYMIIRNSNAFVDMGRITFLGAAGIASSRFINSFPGGLVPNASFASDSGIGAFGVAGAVYEPYMVTLKGALKITTAGGNSPIATVSPPPLTSRRFAVVVESGGSMSQGYVDMNSAGTITFLGSSVLNSIIYLASISYGVLIQ